MKNKMNCSLLKFLKFLHGAAMDAVLSASPVGRRPTAVGWVHLGLLSNVFDNGKTIFKVFQLKII